MANLTLRHGGWAQGPTGSLWNLLREEERQVSQGHSHGGDRPQGWGLHLRRRLFRRSSAAVQPSSAVLGGRQASAPAPGAWEPGRDPGSPAKSEEQKMIERAMESCAFKAALACVGGEGGAGGPWEAEGLGGSGIHCSRPRTWETRGFWAARP